MTQGDISLASAWALVDELVHAGVRAACLSPGSRSTPLALALARHPSIRLEVHLDERSSAFVALGIARATDAPVLVACTSGTAAAELLPAVVEASRSRVPLVTLTADRPPRLRGTGANQTIDQARLYGGYATYLEPPVPSANEDVAAWRAFGRGAVEALRATSQPVHLDCPFEEPLMPTPDASLDEPSDRGRWAVVESVDLDADDADRLREEISARRGVVVVGCLAAGADRVDLGVFERLGWPVVAEPTSNLRRPGVLAAGQALIGDPAWLSAHTPEVVLQVGATPTTRATQAFVASAERLIVADRSHPDPDPEGQASWRLRADLGPVLRALQDRDAAQRMPDGSIGVGITTSGDAIDGVAVHERLRRAIVPAPRAWSAAWRDADTRVRRAIDAAIDGWTEPAELAVARDVARSVRRGGALFVGNSTPIRDLDLAMEPRDHIRVMANRGASGIDGLVSTAIGVAAGSGRPTTALLGDLSTLHDLGALAWNARRIDLDLTLVVVNNGGGNIFSLLPHDRPPEHRQLFVTPPEVDLGAVCAALGMPYLCITTADELRDALTRRTGVATFRVLDVVVDPVADRGRRDELKAAVAAALTD